MWIIGVDYHPSVQQIAFVNTDTGECGERRLNHSDGEAEKFYGELKAAGCKVQMAANDLDSSLLGGLWLPLRLEPTRLSNQPTWNHS
jgi:hypothetical protein